MKRNLVLYLFLLFLIEGSVMPWLIPEYELFQFEPHFVLVAILYAAIFLNRYYALFFGLLFGLLQDFIYYGHMIGLQSFSMGLIGYAAGLLFRNAQVTLLMSLSMILLGNFAYESVVYFLYRLFEIIEFSFEWALVQVIMPSLILNLLFALIIYWPARWYLERADSKRKEKE